MNQFKEILPEQLEENPFQLIGKEWMLITAGDSNKINTMTAAWGGLGIMWGKNVASVVIRPQRYTKEFVDREETFSLSFFNTNYKKQLNYLGSVSGRDEDKITKAGLTVLAPDGTPYFEEARLVLICKKLFAQPFDPACFLDEKQKKVWYPLEDYHTIYFAEITKVLQSVD